MGRLLRDCAAYKLDYRARNVIRGGEISVPFVPQKRENCFREFTVVRAVVSDPTTISRRLPIEIASL